MAIEYVPAEGKVAIQILDDDHYDDDESDVAATGMPTAEENDEAVIAICVGVGPKVSVCKTGDTIYVYPWAKHGLKIGNGTRVVDSYCVAAKVKK